MKFKNTKREIIYNRQRGLCHLCKLPMSPEDATYDHLIPKSQGGTREEGNVMLAHSICNNIRGDNPIYSPQYYIKKTERYHQLKRSRREYANSYVVNVFLSK